MKKLLPLLPVLFLISFGLSQSRVNRGKLSFNGKSEVITKLTGWSYNEKWGEWIDYENVILNEKKYKDEWKNLFMGKFYNSDQHFIRFSYRSRYWARKSPKAAQTPSRLRCKNLQTSICYQS